MAAKAAPISKSSASPPKDMTIIQGGYASTWNVEEMPILEGIVNDVPKTVTLTQGKKQQDRRCVEVRTDNGDRYTVWESAALGPLFEKLVEEIPCRVWISFKGFGKAKKGQNPPKLFDSATGPVK
jgi:hypothetical protein